MTAVASFLGCTVSLLLSWRLPETPDDDHCGLFIKSLALFPVLLLILLKLLQDRRSNIFLPQLSRVSRNADKKARGV